MKPAIAIFAFNRPASLERLLHSLAACPEFPDAQVTVFIDGPRSPSEAAVVSETIRIAREAATPNWRIVPAEANRGLRRSIHSGVAEVCALHGHAIVLEDDLVVAPAALTYFLEGLQRYEHEPRVWSICGYNYEHPKLSVDHRAFFLPFAHPWGWATWKRAWDKFTLDQPRLSRAQLLSPSFRQFFNVAGLIRAVDLIDLSQKGLVDSWFIRWHQKIFAEGGLSVFPSRRYVANLGVGKGGTHASAMNPYSLLVRSTAPDLKSVGDWPSSIEIDFLALDAMACSRDAAVQRVLARLGRIKREVKSFLKSEKQK